MTATKAIDIVGIYDIDFNQVFSDARPLKASVSEEAVFFKHPLENSATRTDHIIFQPVKITMTMIVSGEDYKSIYQQIKQVYKNQTQLIVQTKTDDYENIYIQSIPHEESPDNFDSLIINLALEETLIAVTTIIFAPESDSDNDTKDRGLQNSGDPTDAQSERGSTLYRWFG